MIVPDVHGLGTTLVLQSQWKNLRMTSCRAGSPFLSSSQVRARILSASIHCPLLYQTFPITFTSASVAKLVSDHVSISRYSAMTSSCVGRPSPSCLVVRPFVVALPTVWSFVCAGAASCAYSCSAHVRPCAQGRCGRCPPGSGLMSKKNKNFIYCPSLDTHG